MPLAPEEELEVEVTEAALTGERHSHAYAEVFASGQIRAVRNNAVVRVERLGTGRYRVTVPNNYSFENGFGNFQVVATGTTPNRCKLEDRWRFAEDWDFVQAIVRCHTPVVNSLRDEPFAVSYVARIVGESTTPAAYLMSGGANPVLNEPFLHPVSTGYATGITRAGAGDYTVTFAGLLLNGGTVQVSAIGADRNHCKVRNWYTSGDATVVRVLCFNNANLSDSLFSLNVDSWVSTTYDRGARAWADQPNTAIGVGYTPAAAWSLNTGAFLGSAGVNRAFRTGTGLYRMDHTKVGAEPSGVHVTAYGTGPEYCKLNGSWTGAALGDTSVFVACFDANQNPANSTYVETFQVAVRCAPN